MVKYSFSFTAASALITDFSLLARIIADGKPLEELSGNDLLRDKYATSKREFTEFRKRLQELTPTQIEILANGNFQQQQMITHLALIKTYSFYRDFCEDVLLRKIAVFDSILSVSDYNSFVNSKSIDHPELERLADSTLNKVKQVLFLMLQQVGITHGKKVIRIVTPVLDNAVAQAIIHDNPLLLKSFLYNDLKIHAL